MELAMTDSVLGITFAYESASAAHAKPAGTDARIMHAASRIAAILLIELLNVFI